MSSERNCGTIFTMSSGSRSRAVVRPSATLPREIGAQIIQVRRAGRNEQITLSAVAGRMSQHFFEVAEKRNGVKRHLNADVGRELGAHATHAFARGPFSLVCLAFEDQYVAAAGFGKLIRDARSDDPAANNDYIRRGHGFNIRNLSRAGKEIALAVRAVLRRHVGVGC